MNGCVLFTVYSIVTYSGIGDRQVGGTGNVEFTNESCALRRMNELDLFMFLVQQS